MTWEAAILVLLVVVIVGGFAWYERSKPPSQIVALVAALAALSVAGRVAFSPIPNVLPSTDIIVIAGFTLGGAPGFVVGALTALVSNFWLGQGPWTPWQMAGWGMVGVLAAAFGTLTRGRVGRLPLALFCGLCGFAYGALLDYSLMATYGGEQSLDRFLALSARGLPFNIAHAAGNFTLALIAGPAMVRMLRRYRSRFEYAWDEGGAVGRRRRTATAGVAGALLALLAVAAAAAGPEARATQQDSIAARAAAGPAGAVRWLRGAQNRDGGFGFGRGIESSAGMTAWAALGLEATGLNPLDLRKGGQTPIDYLRANPAELVTAADLERTILALEAAGLDSRRFVGRDLIAKLRKQQRADGSWDGQVNPTAFGVLALDAAGAGSAGSARWLARNQNGNGGWGFAPGTASDADSTGAVLQALAAAGGGKGAIRSGVAYLRGAQQRGGGFALSGGGANAQSTAWAVQGLLAAGVSPSKVRTGGRSPLDYLASLQVGDGHYRYSAGTDQTPVWVTAQALLAVESKPFPLAQVAAASKAGAPAGGSGATAGGTGAASGTGAESAKGSGVAAAVPGSAPVAAATAPGDAAGGPARFETDDDGDSSKLLIAIAVALLAAVVGAVMLRRQNAGG